MWLRAQIRAEDKSPSINDAFLSMARLQEFMRDKTVCDVPLIDLMSGENEIFTAAFLMVSQWIDLEESRANRVQTQTRVLDLQADVRDLRTMSTEQGRQQREREQSLATEKEDLKISQETLAQAQAQLEADRNKWHEELVEKSVAVCARGHTNMLPIETVLSIFKRNGELEMALLTAEQENERLRGRLEKLMKRQAGGALNAILDDMNLGEELGDAMDASKDDNEGLSGHADAPGVADELITKDGKGKYQAEAEEDVSVGKDD